MFFAGVSYHLHRPFLFVEVKFAMPRLILCTPQIGENGILLLRPTYAAALAAHGGVAIMPSMYGAEEAIPLLLDRVSGVLLTGGGDIHPKYYGGKESGDCREICEARDRLEISLCRAAVERRLPLLAICRGIQVLNVALGGTLTDDFPGHMDTFHPIRINAASPLFAMLGEEATVNSFHHQSIDCLAPSLRLAAVAPDGCPEAVFLPNHPFCLGVQWHPERLDAADRDAVFSAFLREYEKEPESPR